MDKLEALEEAGLSTNEAKAYLALLELGETTAGPVSDMAKLHRSNTYDALDKLVVRGLASHITRDGTKHYTAEDPERLLTMVRRKEQDVATVLPELRLAKKLASQPGEAHILEGMKAFRNAFEGLLQYEQPILAYGIPKVTPDMVKHFIMQFHKKRIPKGIVMKHIYNHDASERIAFLKTLDKTEARMLPEKYDSPASTITCGPEVLLTLWKENMITIRIVNEQIAKAHQRYFELLWEQAT